MIAFVSRLVEKIRIRRRERRRRLRPWSYVADGLAVEGKTTAFLNEPRFKAAWEFSRAGNSDGWRGKVPDIRWRAHVACWAAAQGARLEGDFVECGVHTGMLSMTICHFLDFARSDKRFFLFDTFSGIPLETIEPQELPGAERANRHYFDCHALARRNFAAFPNAVLVKGILPQSLLQAPLSRIAYLSVDLNNSGAEKAVIEALWDRLSPSAMVLIDDYGFTGQEAQAKMWDAFAASQDRAIASLPTGQGLLIR